MEMNDASLMDLIAGGSKVIVDVWSDNCPYCTQFSPIFDEVAKEYPETHFVKFNLPKVGSEFKKKYMTLQVGKPNGVPAIFVFEKGEVVLRHHGKIDAKQLKAFVNDGIDPSIEQLEQQKEKAKQELFSLFARRGELSMLLEEMPHIDSKINQIKQFIGAPH